jgi:hypothetical protein
MYSNEIIQIAVGRDFHPVKRRGTNNRLDVHGENGNRQVFGRGEMVEVFWPDGTISRKKVYLETKTTANGINSKAFIVVNVHGLKLRRNLCGLYVRKAVNMPL